MPSDDHADLIAARKVALKMLCRIHRLLLLLHTASPLREADETEMEGNRELRAIMDELPVLAKVTASLQSEFERSGCGHLFLESWDPSLHCAISKAATALIRRFDECWSPVANFPVEGHTSDKLELQRRLWNKFCDHLRSNSPKLGHGGDLILGAIYRPFNLGELETDLIRESEQAILAREVIGAVPRAPDSSDAVHVEPLAKDPAVADAVDLGRTAQLSADPKNSFRKTGTGWRLRFNGGEELPFRALDGLYYISLLLAEPGKRFTGSELFAALGMMKPKPKRLAVSENAGDTRQAANRGKQAELRRLNSNLQDVRKDLEKANRDGDEAAAERLKFDKEQILSEIEELKTAAEKRAKNDRDAVRRTIKLAIAAIAKDQPELAGHLQPIVSRPGPFVYEPSPPVAWDVRRTAGG